MSYASDSAHLHSPVAAGGCIVGLPQQNYSLVDCINRCQYLFHWCHRGLWFRANTLAHM